jgi:hypothetical protein
VLTERRICDKMACKNREAWPKEKATAEYNAIMRRGAGLGGVAPPLMAGEGAAAPLAPPATPSPQVQ